MSSVARAAAVAKPPSLPFGHLLPRSGWHVPLLAIATGIVLWELIGRTFQFVWFPPFSMVAAALWELTAKGLVIANLLASLKSLGIGFLLSVAIGLPIGALMGRYRKVEWALDLHVSWLLISPSIIFAPIFFTIFGLSDATRIAVVVLYAWPIIVYNTFVAFRHVDRELIEMAISFGARESKVFRRVLLPASLPLTMAGLRLGMGRAVKGMINGELFVALVGLGALVEKYEGSFDAQYVLAVVLVVMIVAVFMAEMVQWLDRRLTYWAN
ncbi:MAG TPA: ABC transporter permease subunit [Chloroflexota bacterium]|nr:ABC transporter permease subunit [Chloroflexota bacterium]